MTSMHVKDSVVFVTGANRGVGLALVRAFKAAGAARIYAASRQGADPQLEGVVPLRLDVTDLAEIATLATRYPDVSVLVNNAGVLMTGSALADDVERVFEELVRVNVLGPVRLTRAFAPVLKRNGGGAIVTMHSLLTWLTLAESAAYSASKAASWAFTNGIRVELSAQNTQVMGVHAGFVETDMTVGVETSRIHASDLAKKVIEGIESGASEVLADEATKAVKGALSSNKPAYLYRPKLG